MGTQAEPHHSILVSDSHHRKIELQSSLDLAHLQSNLSASARQKLDLHFPPSAYKAAASVSAQPATIISLDGINAPPPSAQEASNSINLEDDHGAEEHEEQDPLRLRVRQLVDAFMSRTWEAAVKNISVNGMDATLPVPVSTTLNNVSSNEPLNPQQEREGTDFTYEAYDSRLQSNLANLYGELETLTAQVSRLRRTAPKQGAETFQEMLNTGIEQRDADFETQMALLRQMNANVADQNALELLTLRDGWHDDVKSMYERGTGELAGLAGFGVNGARPTPGNHAPHGASLTETVGKVQRARTVVMEFD